MVSVMMSQNYLVRNLSKHKLHNVPEASWKLSVEYVYKKEQTEAGFKII